jgi:glycosyltransferase involved in cell wall biosynthesis
MPLYNAGPWVETAVRSVLDTADGLLELIVIDDGSTDDGPEIVADIEGPIRLVRQENAGASAARNAGIALAQGRFIGFIDSDDVWCPPNPDPRRAALEAGADIAAGQLETMAGEPMRQFAPPAQGPNVGSMIARREVFDDVGGFDETRRHGEDVDWLLRARDAGKNIERIDTLVLQYRMRHGSLMREEGSGSDGLVKALRASLERRGKIGGA